MPINSNKPQKTHQQPFENEEEEEVEDVEEREREKWVTIDRFNVSFGHC